MKTLKEINEIMNTIPLTWRKRWCECQYCACVGCVQIGNRIIMYEKATGKKFVGDPEYISETEISQAIYDKYKISKEEWQLWMNRIEF